MVKMSCSALCGVHGSLKETEQDGATSPLALYEVLVSTIKERYLAHREHPEESNKGGEGR